MADELTTEVQKIIDDHELVISRAKAPKRERNAWITLSRRFFEPGDRRPCSVCGKFQSITQAHHVIPLEVQYDRGFRSPNQEFVWLCPNHHELVHLFIKHSERRITGVLSNDDLSSEELDKILDIIREAGRSPE